MGGGLGPHKAKQGEIVPRVGSPERGDIGLAASACLLDVLTRRPIDRCMPERVCHKYVGGNACMASVSVWEQMDLYKPMMKPRTGFQRTVSLVLRPISDIAQQPYQLRCDIGGINPDVLFGQAEFAGPAPDLAEQPARQFANPDRMENIALARPVKPVEAVGDVRLFQFVELAPCRDVPKLQARHVIGVKRGRAVRLGRDAAHGKSRS